MKATQILTNPMRLLLACLLCISLIGCLGGEPNFSNNDTDTDSTSDQGTSETETEISHSPTNTETATQTETVSLDFGEYINSMNATSQASSGVLPDTTLSIEFKQEMNANSVNNNTQLTRDGNSVAITVLDNEVEGTTHTFTFKPNSALTLETTYQLLVTSSTQTASGATLDSAVGFNFTTRNYETSFSRSDYTQFSSVNPPCCLALLSLEDDDNVVDLVTAGGDGIHLYLNTGSGEFSRSSIYSASDTTTFLALNMTDTNRDGHKDLVLLTRVQLDDSETAVNTVWVYLNQYSSTPAEPFISSNRPITVLSTYSELGEEMVNADFNNDGNADLAVIDQNQTSPKVVILGGVGTGRFTTNTTVLQYAENEIPTQLLAMDINDDDNMDLLVAFENNSKIIVYQGNGNASLVEHDTLIFSEFVPTGMLEEDVNSDGINDLVVSNNKSTPTIDVLLNNGSGTFNLTNFISVSKSPSKLVSGDFNNDGWKDLAVLHSDDEAVSLYQGDGSGAFVLIEEQATGHTPLTIFSANLDNQNSTDLVVGNTDGSSTTLLFSQTNGLYQSPTALAVSEYPVQMGAADLDEDDIQDLLALNQTENNLEVYKGNGSGGFYALGQISLPTGALPTSMALGDFNNDLLQDLVTLNSGLGNLSLFYSGAKALENRAELTLSGSSPQEAIAGDFNNDGFLDLAVTLFDSNQVLVMTNNGILLSDSLQEAYSTGNGPTAIDSAYINEDENLDLLVVNQTDVSISVMLSAGQLGLEQNQVVTIPSQANPPATTKLGDVASITNHSGRLIGAVVAHTLELTDDSSNNLFFFSNSGGELVYTTAMSFNKQIRQLSKADLNGDGIQELLVFSVDSNDNSQLSILTDNGAFEFSAGDVVQIATPDSLNKPAFADLNSDGMLDIVLPDAARNETLILYQK